MSDKRPPLDFEAIRAAANGSYVSTIFPAAGISFNKPHKQHQSCPLCGGNDRFRCDDKRGEGTWICNQCGAGNGFTLVKEFTKLDAYETNQLIAGAIGLDATSEVTDEQRKTWQSQQVERESADKAAKRQERINTANRAQKLWDASSSASDDHPYLLRKNVKSIALKQDTHDNLLIPLYYYNIETQATTLVNLQTIAPDSDKLFLKGGLKKGAYFTVGSQAMFVGKRIIICEGYSTAATVFDALGYSVPVIVAFDAGNLLPVSQAIRAQYPEHRIIFCADDDTAKAIAARNKDIADGKAPKALIEYNAGIRDATTAASAVQGEIIIPNFELEPHQDRTDFNDLAATAGITEVANQIRHGIANPNRNTTAVNDPPTTTPIVQHNGHVPADIEQNMRLQDMLKRFAQITDIGKVTNKVYDLEQKIEYTKTQFAHEIGTKKLADRWWHAKHAKISKAEVAKDRDELLAVEAQPMLDRYFLIYGTKEVWDDVERTRLPVDTIKLARPNEYELWLKSDKRITIKADNIWFDPTRTREPKNPKDISVNMFDGLPLKPIETDIADAAAMCAPIRELLLHLCEGDQSICDWVLRWLAIPLQRPGTKMDTALIFHGEIQGAGKSLFFDRIMTRLYGDYAVTLGQGQLESQYNDWVAGKLYALFEEIFSGSDRYSQMGMVKQLITGDTVYINKKFMSGWQQNNYVNAIFLSNNMMPLSLEQNDRRHVVCYPKQKIPATLLKQTAAALQDPDDKMVRAFYTYLLRLDLKDQNSHTPALMTASKQVVIRLSQPNWETFYDDWSNNDAGVPYCSCLTQDLYDYYQHWCRKGGERGTTRIKLMTYIGRRELKDRLRYQIQGTPRVMQSTIIAINMPTDYPTQHADNQQVWLGQQIQRFKAAISLKIEPK